MEGHLLALGRPPAGGKFSGTMWACISIIKTASCFHLARIVLGI